MDLSQLLDDVMASHAIEVLESGDRLVAMRLPDGTGVGVHLGATDWSRRWDVVEVVVRPVVGAAFGDLPMGSLVAEARRLATRSAQATAA